VPEASYVELATGGFLESIEAKSDSIRFNLILARRNWNMSIEFFIDFSLHSSLIDEKEYSFDVGARSGDLEHLWRLVGLKIGRFSFQPDDVTLEFASERLNDPFVKAHPSVARGFPEQVVFRVHQENVLDHVP